MPPHPSKLESLPSELKLMILYNIQTPPDLKNLLLASKTYYQHFQLDAKMIVIHVTLRDWVRWANGDLSRPLSSYS